MIGLALSVMIQLVVLAIRLTIVAAVWTVRFIVWLIAAIASALSDRRRRRPCQRFEARNARVPIDPDVRWAIFQRDGYACTGCGSRSDLTLDHVHAVSLGSNDPSNLRTICVAHATPRRARELSARSEAVRPVGKRWSSHTVPRYRLASAVRDRRVRSCGRLVNVDSVRGRPRLRRLLHPARGAELLPAHGGPNDDPHRLDGDGDGRACARTARCRWSQRWRRRGGRGGGAPPSPPRDLSDRARVVDVVDGDTITARVHGKTRDVRLIGIDTPEVYGGRECGGPQASAAMRRLLDRGDRVELIRDPSQDAVDHYGRLLRYVEHSSIDVGHQQILRGRARVYVYDDNAYRRVSSYRKAQREAKRHDRGAWGDCGRHFHFQPDPVNEAGEPQ